MLKENYTIKKTRQSMRNRNPFATVVLLFIFMQLPMLIVGIGYGIFIALTNPELAGNPQVMMEYITGIDPDYQRIGSLFLTALVSISVYIFARTFQKRDNESLGLTSSDKLKNYLKGALLGTLMIVAVVLILKVMGVIEINNNISNVSPFLFILIIIGWMLQGFEEELVARSVLMNYFAAKYSVMAGIIINSLIFSLLHLPNNAFGILPAINIFLVGILFSLLFYVSDDIFLPAAVHSFWNFAQGNIFGISVSGTGVSNSTLFKSTLLTNPLMTGGEFGIEGGLICTLVEGLVVIYLIKKAKEKNDSLGHTHTETVVIEKEPN